MDECAKSVNAMHAQSTLTNSDTFEYPMNDTQKICWESAECNEQRIGKKLKDSELRKCLSSENDKHR
jgi:hypothetical protein